MPKAAFKEMWDTLKQGHSWRGAVKNLCKDGRLKGPGSALYGRSEPGGTVNIVTKKPQFEQQGELKLSLGSDNFNRVEGDYTTSIFNV